MLISLLFLGTGVFAYDKEFSQSEACYLTLKVTGEKPDPDASVGSGVIEVFMVDGNKAPLEGIEITLQANGGTFQCYSSGSIDESSESDSLLRACFKTDAQGKARIHFVNIPFNLPVNIKAAAECSGMTVYGKGSILLKKQTRQTK